MTNFSSAQQGVLDSLLNRLEGVTSRLEGLQVRGVRSLSAAGCLHVPALITRSAILQEASIGVTPSHSRSSVPTKSAAPSNEAASADASTSVADYTSLTDPAVSALVEAARPLGADVRRQNHLLSHVDVLCIC